MKDYIHAFTHYFIDSKLSTLINLDNSFFFITQDSKQIFLVSSIQYAEQKIKKSLLSMKINDYENMFFLKMSLYFYK